MALNIADLIDQYIVAAKRRGMSIDRVAEEFGVVRKTIDRWRNGCKPKVESLARIAELTNVHVVELYVSVGLIDEDGLGLALRAGRTVTAMTDGVRRVEDLVMQTTLVNGGSVAAAVSKSGRWETIVVPSFMRVWAGSDPVDLHRADYVGFAAPSREHPFGEANPLAADIIEEFGQELSAVSAMPEDDARICAELSNRHPAFSTWFVVPRLSGPIRPPAAQPVDLGSVRTIFVLGTHYAGQDDVAALLSNALGWGYANTSLLASVLYGRSLAVSKQVNRVERQKSHDTNGLAIARLAATTSALDSHVLALGNPNILNEVIDLVNAPKAERLIVLIATTPEVAEMAERETRGRPDEVTAAQMVRDVERARTSLKELEVSRKALVLESHPTSDFGAAFHLWVDHFAHTYRWLQEVAGAERPTTDVYHQLVESR